MLEPLLTQVPPKIVGNSLLAMSPAASVWEASAIWLPNMVNTLFGEILVTEGVLNAAPQLFLCSPVISPKR